MNTMTARRLLSSSAIVVAALAISNAHAQSSPAPAHTPEMSTSTAAPDTAQPRNGITYRNGQLIVQVVALRDDVFRVRVGRDGKLPEDASWAASAASRGAGVAITRTANGFSTASAQVSINAATGAVTLSDRNGRTILADSDARPYQSYGKGFRLVKDLPSDTHIFGLGDKPGPLDRRGYTYQNWNTDSYTYQERQDPLYKDIPFFIAYDKGRSYGVFMDNTWRSVFDFGVNDPGKMSFGADGGAIDYYVFTGPTPKDVLSAYGWLTGIAPLPPKWAFGFQQSRYSYPDARTVRDIAAHLRRDHIPADAIWFDIGVQNHNRPFTINQTAFPDFKGLVKDLHDQHLHSVVIADLHVARQPNIGYTPYDIGAAQNMFVHRPDGSVYVGPVWPGPAVFPDFTDQKARDYWGSLFKHHYIDNDLDGFWNDMNEPSIFTALKTMPNDNVHRIDEPGFQTRTATHEEMHNVYGMENGRATYEGLLKLKPNQRPFVMMRASYAGGQRFATTWTGDNTSTWNHLRISTPMLLSLGLGGFTYAGDNLGGFVGSPPPDLLTKWLEIGMFNPIAEDHSDLGTRMQEPWVDGKAQEDIRRRFIEDRYRLMPYIYTMADEASRTGIPIMRPLFLEFPDAANGLALDLQAPAEFMWGSDILVAPPQFLEQVDAYKVILPPGGWFDYWTGMRIENPAVAEATGNSGTTTTMAADPAQTPHTVNVTPNLSTLAVYARAGSIIPRQPLTQSTDETPKGNLELHVYAGKQMSGQIYVDDGRSLDYQHGKFFRQHYAAQFTDAGNMVFTASQPEGQSTPWWNFVDVVVHGVKAGTDATHVNGATNVRYDGKTETLRFTVPRFERQTSLTLHINL